MGLSVQMAGSLRAISHSDHHRRNHSDHPDEGCCWPQWQKWHWKGKCQLIDSTCTAPPVIDRSGLGLLDSDDFQLLSEFGHQSEKRADKAIKLAAFAITFPWGSWNDSQIHQSLRLGKLGLIRFASFCDKTPFQWPFHTTNRIPFKRRYTTCCLPLQWATAHSFLSAIHTPSLLSLWHTDRNSRALRYLLCFSVLYTYLCKLSVHQVLLRLCNLRSRLLSEVILIVSPSYIFCQN